MYLQKSKNLPSQTLLFQSLKFISRRIRCAVNILEDFTEENSRFSQMIKLILLTEMIEHYLIIAYYM